jgi:hypothetical protein
MGNLQVRMMMRELGWNRSRMVWVDLGLTRFKTPFFLPHLSPDFKVQLRAEMDLGGNVNVQGVTMHKWYAPMGFTTLLYQLSLLGRSHLRFTIALEAWLRPSIRI